jgi:hypothetical protein
MAEHFDRIDMPRPAEVDFEAIPADRLREMAEAGADVIECHRVLANSGGNIVGELLRDVETFYEWDHYPPGDVYDTKTHSQFYYHAHPQELRSHEHGHFHTFLRPPGMPKGVRPATVGDFRMPDDPNDALSHLIAISMDKYGVPIRLFTTNRWVTGEIWYAADHVRAMLDRFLIDHAQPSWPVNRWVSGMIRLFRPQIIALIDARDAAIERWRAAYPDRNVFEDEALEITSMLDVDIDRQIARVKALLETGNGQPPA